MSERARGLWRSEMPERIGPFRLVRRIGEGGMGAVYIAEQDSPRREVALKVLRAGSSSRESLRRFEHEAQVLGRLNHPGIAQVFEAGTFDGPGGPQPYFAMELVDGERLDEYLLEISLGTRDRIRLLVRICDAVQHAHQKGVIHRDIKPANILVDAQGNPKILDFGVARVTDRDLQATTLRTNVGELLGTLPYMSPEQTRGDPAEVDTRTDVYALGVLGFEMLTGQLPYELPKHAPWAAIRVIQESAPRRLSSLDRILRGDLDTIFQKVLEKDKARRYASASSFASDLECYIGQHPISARPPTTFYQLTKFAARNRALVGGSIGIAAALLVGSIVSTVQYFRAENQRKIADDQRMAAELAADEARAIDRYIVEEILGAATPGREGREVRVADLLDRAGARVGESFAGQPVVEASVRRTLGNTYRELGLLAEARPHLERAHALRVERFGAGSLEALETQFTLAELDMAQDETERGLASVKEVVARRTELLGPEDPLTLEASNSLVFALCRLRRYEEADVVARATLAAYERRGPLEKRGVECQLQLGSLLAWQGKLDEAESVLGEAVEGFTRIQGPEGPGAMNALFELGQVYRSRMELEKAEQTLRRVLDASRTLYGDSANAAGSMTSLADVLRQERKYDEAEPLYREALAIYEKRLGADHTDALVARSGLAEVLGRTRRFDESLALHHQNLEHRRAKFGARSVEVAQSLGGIGGAAFVRGDMKEAAKNFTEQLAIQRETLGSDHPDLATTLSNLSEALRRQKDWTSAEPLLRELMELDVKVMDPANRFVLTDRLRYAAVLFALGRYGECEREARTVIELREKETPTDNDVYPESEYWLGKALAAQQEYDEAEAMLASARQRYETKKGPTAEDTLATARALAELYRSWGKPELAAKWDAPPAEAAAVR